MDDTSEPIISGFFYVLDLIIFLGMVSGAVMMMRVGNQVNENAKNGMVDRDILTAEVDNAERHRFLYDERDASGNRAWDASKGASRMDSASPATAYDGMLTGEEVVNAILAMRYYHDAYASPAQTSSNGAYFDARTGEICPKVVVVNNGTAKDVGTVAVQVQRNGATVNMSAIRYAQEFDVGVLSSKNLVYTGGGWLYKRTYTIYDDGSGNPDQKALQKQITYTRVSR